MSQPIRTANDIDGVPAEVVSLFDECRVDLAVFAMQGNLEVRPYENHDQADGTWAWNFYGRAWGRKVCIQVSTSPVLARNVHFNIGGYVHQQELFGPQAKDDFWELKVWTTSSDYLKTALGIVAAHVADFVRGLPLKPASPETV
jgi:hypothetical protein